LEELAAALPSCAVSPSDREKFNANIFAAPMLHRGHFSVIMRTDEPNVYVYERGLYRDGRALRSQVV
jgi:hypothetical protein